MELLTAVSWMGIAVFTSKVFITVALGGFSIVLILSTQRAQRWLGKQGIPPPLGWPTGNGERPEEQHHPSLCPRPRLEQSRPPKRWYTGNP